MDETDASSGTADQLKLIVLMENLLGQGKDYELTEDDVARVFVESGQEAPVFCSKNGQRSVKRMRSATAGKRTPCRSKSWRCEDLRDRRQPQPAPTVSVPVVDTSPVKKQLSYKAQEFDTDVCDAEAEERAEMIINAFFKLGPVKFQQWVEGIAQVRELIVQGGARIAPENEADILHVLCETTHNLGL